MSIASEVAAVALVGAGLVGAWIYRQQIFKALGVCDVPIIGPAVCGTTSTPQYQGTAGTGVTIPVNQQNAPPGTTYIDPYGNVVVVVTPAPAGTSYSSQNEAARDYCRRNPWDTNFCSKAYPGGI